MQLIKNFIATFPTATILYVLLVLFTDLTFEWSWLIFAIVIDIIDDAVLGRVV